jgi:DNA-directed RNA polymerase specialized sigma24 family protein
MNDTNAQPEDPRNSYTSTFSAIFDKYALIIHGYVVRFCHDPEEADRIVGDVFTQFLEKLSLRKRPSSNPRIILYRTAYDTVAGYLRAGGKKLPSFIPSLPSREEEQALTAAAFSALNKRPDRS